MTPQGWTDARVEMLKHLWLSGQSAAQLAKTLGGVSRKAVIGKLHRLGLTGVRGPVSRPRRIAPAARPRRSVRRGAAKQATTAPVPAAAPAPLPAEPGLVRDTTGLRLHVCKWPIGDPQAADFSFCGCRTRGDGPYCSEHHRLAHRPARAQPLDRDSVLRRLLAA